VSSPDWPATAGHLDTRLMKTEPLNTNASRRTRRRRGLLSMELVLTLPILGILLLGLFEFSMLFFARGDVVDACRAGAKQASLQGATEEDVEAAVLNALSGRLQANAQVETQLGEHSGDPIAVAVSVPMGAASPDLLWVVGFSLQNEFLYCETRMTKE